MFYLQADLFAGAVFIKQSIGWDIWGAIIALLILAMLFTIGGKYITLQGTYMYIGTYTYHSQLGVSNYQFCGSLQYSNRDWLTE